MMFDFTADIRRRKPATIHHCLTPGEPISSSCSLTHLGYAIVVSKFSRFAHIEIQLHKSLSTERKRVDINIHRKPNLST